jgi:DNA-binding HxlR family transcriptional regulator
MQVNIANVTHVAKKTIPARRSGCPVNISLEVFGDQWSLQIVRNLMVRSFHALRDFEHAGEGIAMNIPADQLRRLCRAGIEQAERDPADGRQKEYRLTKQGIDLAAVLLELLICGASTKRQVRPLKSFPYGAKPRCGARRDAAPLEGAGFEGAASLVRWTRKE